MTNETKRGLTTVSIQLQREAQNVLCRVGTSFELHVYAHGKGSEAGSDTAQNEEEEKWQSMNSAEQYLKILVRILVPMVQGRSLGGF